MALNVSHPLPDLLELGVDTELSMRVFEGADAVIPSAASVKVYDEGNTLLTTVAGTIEGATGIVTATVPAAITTGKSPSDRWYTIWVLTVAGVAKTFRFDCYLCRYIAYCPITQADLLKRHPDLLYHKPDTWSDFSPAIESGWVEMQSDLISLGNRPNLILESFKLRKPLVALVLYRLYAYFQSRAADPAAWAEPIKVMQAEYQASWKGLNFRYNTEDTAENSEDKQAVYPVLYLTGR